ncbi:unnamed protein product [Mytilus edulis]|uniref:Uncharacterized protein n=1 Tax=Mytilus edulis TaxID=6550 RepID=A0A8S3V7G1_MYTED|nr:unnamed protein product [Mytilus edulis]
MGQFKTTEEETNISPSPQRYQWGSSKHQKKKHIHPHRHKDTNGAVQNTKRKNIYIPIATKISMGQLKTTKEETYTSPSSQRYQWGSSKHQKKKHIHPHRHKDTNGAVQNTKRKNIYIPIATKISMGQLKTPKEETYTSPCHKDTNGAVQNTKRKNIYIPNKDINGAVKTPKRRNIYIPIVTKIPMGQFKNQKKKHIDHHRNKDTNGAVQNTRRRNIYITIATKIPMGQFKTPKEETYTSPSPQRYQWGSSKHQKKKHIDHHRNKDTNGADKNTKRKNIHPHRHKDTNGAVQNTKRRNIYITIATKIPMGQFKTPKEETYTSPSPQNAKLEVQIIRRRKVDIAIDTTWYILPLF